MFYLGGERTQQKPWQDLDFSQPRLEVGNSLHILLLGNYHGEALRSGF